jgi:hypothetical protein
VSNQSIEKGDLRRDRDRLSRFKGSFMIEEGIFIDLALLDDI